MAEVIEEFYSTFTGFVLFCGCVNHVRLISISIHMTTDLGIANCHGLRTFSRVFFDGFALFSGYFAIGGVDQ